MRLVEVCCCVTIGYYVFKFILFLLKVPKCEIFDRSDFQDFYTIKPMWISDFGARQHLISNANAELAHQFLMRTLSARISS